MGAVDISVLRALPVKYWGHLALMNKATKDRETG